MAAPKASKLPPQIANASLEELQKLVMESLRKLKAKDKKLAETEEALAHAKEQLEAAPAEGAQGGGAAGQANGASVELASLQEQVPPVESTPWNVPR